MNLTGLTTKTDTTDAIAKLEVRAVQATRAYLSGGFTPEHTAEQYAVAVALAEVLADFVEESEDAVFQALKAAAEAA